MWRLYAPGLAIGAAVGSWSYLFMLWSGLGKRLGRILGREDFVYLLKLLAAAVTGALAGVLFELAAAPTSPYLADLLSRIWVTAGTLGTFGAVYLATARLLGVSPPGGLKIWQDRAS